MGLWKDPLILLVGLVGPEITIRHLVVLEKSLCWKTGLLPFGSEKLVPIYFEKKTKQEINE